MEDLVQLYDITESASRELEQLTEEWLVKLRAILFGHSAIPAAAKEVLKEIPAASPQQTKKRVKRLSSLNEEEGEDNDHLADKNKKKEGKLSKGHVSPRKSKRSNADLLAVAETMENTNPPPETEVPVPRKRQTDVETDKKETTAPAPAAERKSEASNLMPPPPAPIVTAAPTEEVVTSGRPKREARIKCEKNLKEPTLKNKMRQPSVSEVKVKLEHEQRPSQMHEKSSSSQKTATLTENSPEDTIGSVRSTDSILILPPQKPACIVINENSDDEGVGSTATSGEAEAAVPNEPCASEENGVPSESSDAGTRSLRIKIKREKVSLPSQKESVDESVFKAPTTVPQPLPAAAKSETTTLEESSMASNSVLSSTTASSTAGKKTRKKKEAPRPIKVERFSDLDRKPSPISSRTRQGSTGRRMSQNEEKELEQEQAAETTKRGASIYEDAVEAPPVNNSKLAGIVNETVNLGPSPVPADATINLGPVPGDATFCTNPAQTTFQVTPGQTTFVVEGNPNATVTLNQNSGADATFDVRTSTKADKHDDDGAGQRSFETAKDSSMPHDESLLTEDESIEKEPPAPAPVPVAKSKSSASAKTSKTSASAKATYKMPTRTNELFNPLAQSPVKMRVEAFENAAAAASEQSKRPQRGKKENVTPNGSTTPVIGKLPAPALGRFLTPTQSSNVATTGSAVAKKVPTSASKTMQKSASGMLQRSASTASSTKTLQRENSADDFRKGLHNLAEERKKQREQKHLLAAQQREAKERERAERMAKLAKEREEKRLQKQQEQEQKRRELEEIQRKLRLQEEEAARAKAAKERELLLQMKQQQMHAKQRMMPPPPKATSKYTFEMLHEDDSTDDEDKVSYKRPPPPSWSRTHKREPYVLKQEYTPSSYIDSFFSVQPMTPDLKQIFPNIDSRHLKRNSSVLWSTPPRYSELPKY
ncbi:inner centromere protein isoform X2 [Musca domestica]|uniref:Inner centromere protein isoform X2 n=1 Tax=Musca domestica TaxID=7370 RepID=A0A9J7I663_MUSDO|nr:inner centromere protein isoform X2 [Musca domestica]